MMIQYFKLMGVPGPVPPREIEAAHPAVRVIDGKADIIPGDIGYYPPTENWRRLVETPGTPVKRHHIGMHWIPMLTGVRTLDKWTLGLPDNVQVWDGDLGHVLIDAVASSTAE